MQSRGDLTPSFFFIINTCFTKSKNGGPIMLNGLWTVEFTTTINRYGRGVLVINEGRLLGGDNGYYYTGTCNIDGNSFDGEISVIRYDENFISVFGDISHFQLDFEGVSGAQDRPR